MSLLTELNRRNVFRAVLAYAVAGWLLVEVMELLTDAFEAPPWVLKVFIGAVLLGVLPVSIFSWVYEITPGGIRKDSAQEGAAGPGRKLNIAVIIMLLIAIGLVLEQRFSRQDAVSPPAVVDQAVPPQGPPVLAVLPFVSKTSTRDEEVFAAGVHDDLLTQLAQLQSLRVISRTSVLEYRDTAKNIREIGQELGADAILEGGIQVVGTRARINLQLIDARADEHLWAKSFDRELQPTNMFDVQTDIASAVTAALRITLTEQDATRINALPTENMAAYRAYLRAMRIRDEPGKYDASGFRRALEEAVSLDPGYARAWAELVGAISFGLFSAETSSDEYAEGVERVEKMLEKIRSLAPNSAEHLAAQTFYTYYVLKNYERAHQLAQQAHQLQPGDARLLELKSWIERRTGDYGAMTESLKLIRGLDPRNPRSSTGPSRP